MNKQTLALLAPLTIAGMLAGCSHLASHKDQPSKNACAALNPSLEILRQKYAPDNHMGIFNVGIERRDGQLVLTGEVDRAEAKLETLRAAEGVGVKARDQIAVLPAAELGGKVWGIVSLSVANGREHPDHKAEMGTQILMGHVVRLWKETEFWSRVQSSDGYLAWVEKGALVRCSRETAEAWKTSPLVIVTAF